jgi:hypothetical protein
MIKRIIQFLSWLFTYNQLRKGVTESQIWYLFTDKEKFIC